jgi:tellurite resistance protein
MSLDPDRSLARLAVAVMMSDGRVRPGEEASTRTLARSAPRPRCFDEELELARHQPIDVEAACEELRRSSPESPQKIVRALAEVALGDGKVSSVEYDTLTDIGVRLGLTRELAAKLVREVVESRGLGE